MINGLFVQIVAKLLSFPAVPKYETVQLKCRGTAASNIETPSSQNNFISGTTLLIQEQNVAIGLEIDLPN